MISKELRGGEGGGSWVGRLLEASSPEGTWWGGVTGWRPSGDPRRVAHEAEGPCGPTGSATSGVGKRIRGFSLLRQRPVWSFLSEGAHSEATRRRGQALAEGGHLHFGQRRLLHRHAARTTRVCRVRGSRNGRGQSGKRRGVQAGTRRWGNPRFPQFPGPAGHPLANPRKGSTAVPVSEVT